MTYRAVLAIIAAFVVSTPGFATTSDTSLLKGQVRETKIQVAEAQHRHLGFAVGNTVVTKVYPGTAAYLNGLRSGDRIVNENLQEEASGLKSVLTFERAGKKYSLQLNAPGDFRRFLRGENPEPEQQIARALPAQADERKSEPPPKLIALQAKEGITGLRGSSEEMTLQAKTERVFRGRDLVVLIDQSGSMDTGDCPGAMTRWNWCRQQMVALSEATKSVFPTGFRLGLFNNHVDVSENANVDSIVSAFEHSKPEGGTYTGDAITHELRAQAARKRGGSAKPLVIAIVTDGAPSSASGLRNTLVAATSDMATKDDLQVVFIQIGEDDQATELLENLDQHLLSAGARFPIVHAVSFDKVKSLGLLQSIAEALAK